VNLNSRVVRLDFTADATTQQAAFTIPASKHVLPPQYYMLFLLNDKTHSQPARWVHVLP
jgi:hypothetical protein